MKFAILVNASPYQHQATDTAYHFITAALAAGHEIMRVFFYHDGVYNAVKLSVPPQDERHIIQRWQTLAAEYQVDLVICIAAAQRRGVIDAKEATRQQLEGDNVADGFRIAGLGQLMEACIQADRFVSFVGD